ncbi:hypothetical protein SPFM20_00119 [Salmonella phage SPFM20]|nr:hypothetical protein SPFM20_00119 [Salmonella phage SPFM20]
MTFFRCSSGFIGEVPTPITVNDSPTYSFSDVNPYTGEGGKIDGNVNTTTGERYYRINNWVAAWDGGKLESPMMFKDTMVLDNLQMMPRSVTVMDVGANHDLVIYTCTGTQEKFVDYRPAGCVQSPSNIGQFSATPVKNTTERYSMKRLFIVFAIINLFKNNIVGLIWQ